MSKRQKWLAEYLRCWNATEAARRAGYSYPDKAGPAVKKALAAEIQAELEARLMSADEALDRLGEQARAEYAGYLSTGKDGQVYVDMARLLADGKGHLVKGVKPTAHGQVIEFYDAQTALVHIGRHHGLFTDRQAVTGEVVTMTLDEWREREAKQVAQAEETLRLFEEPDDAAEN